MHLIDSNRLIISLANYKSLSNGSSDSKSIHASCRLNLQPLGPTFSSTCHQRLMSGSFNPNDGASFVVLTHNSLMIDQMAVIPRQYQSKIIYFFEIDLFCTGISIGVSRRSGLSALSMCMCVVLYHNNVLSAGYLT